MKLLIYSISASLLLCLLISCERDPLLYEISNLNGNKISAFGHGGMGIKFKYPIDCTESIDSCMEFGADGTEMDIQLTKDSVLVVHHGQDLNESTLCDGMINDKLWSQIWGCHYVSPLSYRLALTSLHDVFESLSDYDGIYTLDCKLYSNSSDPHAFKLRFANAIIRFIDDNHVDASKIFIESQDTTFLRMLINKNRDLKLFFYPQNFSDGLTIAKKMNLFGITISNENITKDQVAYAHENGIRVTLWNTRNQKENLNAITKSPDFIQSDDIIYLLKVFGKLK
ncbi:MAG: glycerophosphoryl diester phosphodiesterase [Bacteroidota bacterium]|jgi:glycerophosphoryl diester phosphodiesterase|nr:glycerophosphoryl diester phosphodiesterase [Bacteroidota bacterium]